MSLRLEEQRLEIDGKVYVLRCNMAVLDALEDTYGSFQAVMDLPMTDGLPALLAAMLNDYADEQGWEERWTPKAVGRKLGLHDIPKSEIMRLVPQAIVPPNVSSQDTQEAGPDPGHSGN